MVCVGLPDQAWASEKTVHFGVAVQFSLTWPAT